MSVVAQAQQSLAVYAAGSLREALTTVPACGTRRVARRWH